MSLLNDRIRHHQLAYSKPAITIAGRIRPGSRVMTKAGTNNPAIKSIYEQAVSGQITFDQASAKAKELGVANAFRPTNHEHFAFSAKDTDGGQAVVDAVYGLYAEDKGQGLKLYRLPVVFPDLGGVDALMPAKFLTAAAGKGQPRYFSGYTEDGKTRLCMKVEPVAEKPEKGSRIKRLPRVPIPRGKCEPENCPEFKSGKCKFRGEILFYIPGVPGLGAFSLGTSSAYACEEIYLQLTSLYRDLNGQIPQLDHKGNPVFFLTKALRERIFVNDEGQEERAKQWVPILQSNVDMVKVIAGRMFQASPSQQQAAVMTPDAWVDESAVAGMSALCNAPSPTLGDLVGTGSHPTFVGATPVAEHASIQRAQSEGSKKPMAKDAPKAAPAVAPDGRSQEEVVESIETKLEIFGVSDELFDSWVHMRFGEDWLNSIDQCRVVESTLGTYIGRFSEGTKDYLELQVLIQNKGMELKSTLDALSAAHRPLERNLSTAIAEIKAAPQLVPVVN